MNEADLHQEGKRARVCVGESWMERELTADLFFVDHFSPLPPFLPSLFPSFSLPAASPPSLELQSPDFLSRFRVI